MADDPASTLATWRALLRGPLSNASAQMICREVAPPLLAALEAVLKLTRDSAGNDKHRERVLTVGQVRAAIIRELTKEAGDGG